MLYLKLSNFQPKYSGSALITTSQFKVRNLALTGRSFGIKNPLITKQSRFYLESNHISLLDRTEHLSPVVSIRKQHQYHNYSGRPTAPGAKINHYETNVL